MRERERERERGGREREAGVGSVRKIPMYFCGTLMQIKCKLTNRLGPELWNKQLVLFD